MDTRNGTILERHQIPAGEEQHFIPIDVPLSPRQNRLRRIGRNDPCPCGSGNKFKHCHLRKRLDQVTLLRKPL